MSRWSRWDDSNSTNCTVIGAEIILQSVDAEFHTIVGVLYTNSSTVCMQGTMYLRALMIRLWDLNTAAITTQQQWIEEAITSYWIAEKDQFFDARRWATVVQAALSAYKKIFELTSGTKDTMKTANDTSILLLHVVWGFEHPTNLYFAEQMIEHIESSTNAYSLDDVLRKIVDHYNCAKQIGPVKREPQVVRQSDGKDCKKRKVIS